MGKLLPQLLFTALCNFGSFFMGLHVGWMPTLTNNQEYNQLKWLQSLPAITIIFSAPLFGFFLQRFGRKKTLIITVAPNLLIFGIHLISDYKHFQFIDFFVGGFVSAGALIVTPYYVSENVEEKWRGFLGGLAPFFTNVGTLIALFVRPSIDSTLFNGVFFLFTLMALLSFIWLPESPLFLISLNDSNAAARNLQKLGRQLEDAEREIVTISESFNIVENFGYTELLKIVRDQVLRRWLMIVLVVLFLQQISGVSPIIFSVLGYQNEGCKVVILAGCLHLLGSTIAPVFLYFFGRKTILLFSSFIMTLALAALSHLILMNASYLLRLIAFAVFILSYNSGVRSVPYVFLPDVMPPESRGVIPGFSLTVVTVLVLIVNIDLNFMRSYACIFFWLTGCSVFGTAIIFLQMFETRGKSMKQIHEIFSG